MKRFKKVIVFVLTMTMLVSMFVVPAAAADEVIVDTSLENMEIGKTSSKGTVLDDGTVKFTDIEQISYKLPEGTEIIKGEIYEVHVTGSCVGNFRTWFANNAETGSTPAFADALGVTDGDFDVVFKLDMTIAAVNCIIFKGPAYGTNLNELNIKTISVKKAEPAPVVTDPVPTTGDATPVAIVALVAVAAMGGIIVSNRKKAFR